MQRQHVYCTYFDSGYLARALTLFDSLDALGDSSPIWVLCLDEPVYEFVRAFDDARIRALRVDELEKFEPRLLGAKNGRTFMEYIFTCTPVLLRYAMAASDSDTLAVYVDADLCFFDDTLRPVVAMTDASVGIIEHGYPKNLRRRLAKYGRFNVGWVGIRNDQVGRDCASWWADRTIEWCFDTPEPGRYADQGYLDRFPELFERVAVLSDPGFNLAPWNTAASSIRQTTTGITVDGSPLCFFHFHGVRRRGPWYISSQLLYRSSMTAPLRNGVYRPYFAALQRNEAVVGEQLGATKPAPRGRGLRGFLFAAQRWLLDLASKLTGNALRLHVR